ncbi:hypothetical protein FJTKL_07928 [Diaporthe vaccinii]|uniref:Transmembrane protein n=1 Tax=Diaporthe vaccinii TaxID=105482 RepID=A0ABR4FDV2_9PEZI
MTAPVVARKATRSDRAWRLMRTTVLGLSNVITLPYYRFYRQNTLLPIVRLAKSVEDKDPADLIYQRLHQWQTRKLDEYRFVQLSASLLAAAVIGSFSWPIPETIHWLSPASWRRLNMVVRIKDGAPGDLLISTAAPPEPAVQPQAAAQATTGPTGGQNTVSPGPPPVRAEVRWNMVFTWQAPMMLLSYSLIGFVMGLTICILTPLYDGRNFDVACKIAILYIVFSIFAGVTFVWCSFWEYMFIDLGDL